MTINTDMPECTVAMMLAMDKNKLIGKEGGMPWFIPGEMAYFKKVTMGKPVVMGRKTFDSIGKPLPGRPNFVVTRNADWSADGVETCTSLNAAIEGATDFYAKNKTNSEAVAEHRKTNEIFVIGGAGLCREAMPDTVRIYLTDIDHEFEGDIWFDSFDWNDWQVISRQDNQHESLKYSYLVLERA